MKKYLLLLTSFILINESKGQTSAQLDINNINATVNSVYYPMFYNSQNVSAGFEAPKGSNRHSIFASNLWIGGVDANSQLKLATGRYGAGHDFIPGPMMDFAQYASQIPLWNRVWKIERSDILNHINNYNQTGYIIPQVFLDWPAHGNVALGQAADLAPFYDNDNDGNYDPSQGDYPLVPGDECVFFIFNDDTVHTESGGDRIRIEVQAFVYAFNCPGDSALQNTVFVKYNMTNRGTQTLFNTSIGIFSDMDLGGANDDYMGCNLEKGSFFAYAGDNFDEATNGTFGYGDSLSSQAMVFLGGPHKDADGIDNPLTANIQNAIDSSGIPYDGLGMNYGNGIVDDERLGLGGFSMYTLGAGPMGDPQNAADIYNALTGNWSDGTHIYYGGTGYISSAGAVSNGLIETNYMYPGTSDPFHWGTSGNSPSTINWSEETEGNTSGDRRGLGWTGLFTLTPGSIHEIDFAYVFARDNLNLNDPQAPISILNDRIDSVRNYFNAQLTPCNTFYTLLGQHEIENNISFSLYPNPSTNDFTIYYEGDSQKLNYSVHDILGKEIVSGKIISIQTKIDCSNWSKGVYLVKVGNENGYKVEKIIVE